MHAPVSRTTCPNTLSRRPDVRCSSRFSSSPIHHNPPTKLDNNNDNDPRAVRGHPTHLLTPRCPQGRCGVVSSRRVTGPLNTRHVLSELLSLVPEVPDPRTRRSPQLARNATRPGEGIRSKVEADQGATGFLWSISWLFPIPSQLRALHLHRLASSRFRYSIQPPAGTRRSKRPTAPHCRSRRLSSTAFTPTPLFCVLRCGPETGSPELATSPLRPDIRDPRGFLESRTTMGRSSHDDSAPGRRVHILSGSPTGVTQRQ